jgi:uroporphyrin-III C-methyltransferase
MTDNSTLPVEPAAPIAVGQAAIAARWVWLALLLAALAMAGVLWQAQRLSATQAELARRLLDTRAEAVSAVGTANKAEAMVNDLSARLGVTELKVSEVSLQRSQLEELILTVSRSRDDSLVFDLESSIRLALQQSQLTGSPQPLLAALQAATTRIERAAQPRLNPVQRAMQRDIERLQAAALLDVPQLVARIDEMVRQSDGWALRNDVFVRDSQPAQDALTSRVTEAITDKTVQSGTEAQGREPVGSDTQTESTTPASLWSRFNTWRTQWTDQLWTSIRAGTSDLVRVSRIDRPEAALLAPEQSYFLRENIKLVLLNARLALLAGQLETARADLATAHGLLSRYFNDQTGMVRVAMVTLEQMQKDARLDPLPRPDETLHALAIAASGR